ncbi:MAG: agmatine deiminase family protein [Alloprevotella sp.]|nr:agmatine deiminase family protein [Alloprevotella sp.]
MRNNPPSFILPAEWEHPSAVLLAWPHQLTDWVPVLDQAQKCISQIARSLLDRNIPVIILSPEPKKTEAAIGYSELLHIVDYLTNDTWTRDYGPISVIDKDLGHWSLLDFQFNGWGLKFAANRDNLASLALQAHGCFKAPLVNRRSFILEGGSIDTDGNGLLLTTSRCLLSPDRNGAHSKEDIQALLAFELGLDRQIWLDHGALSGDDTDSHIDTLARFAPGGKVLYCSCSNPYHPDYEELKLMEEELQRAAAEHTLSLIPLPLPEPILDVDNGSFLPVTYANFLALDSVVLIPSYGQPDTDLLACNIIREAFNRPVEMIDCRVLVGQHGSLHCTTMQIPLQAII